MHSDLAQLWHRVQMVCFGSFCVAAALSVPVPAVEMVKVYGKLAGPECFGRIVPASVGASCQLPLSRLAAELELEDGPVDEAAFESRLDSLSFRWPLKPYGTAGSDSNVRTVGLNKNAETALYMGELETRGLYDKHNPSTPLPTSLRPTLNAALQREKVPPEAASLAFRSLSGGARTLSADGLARLGPEPLDYFSFIDLVGKMNMVWPAGR